MDKIIMLGTGNGGTLDLYNTCFAIQHDNDNFLVDTGGSIEIIKKLNQANIDYKKIKHIFISHSHTDHILGIFWLFKKLSRLAMHGEINEKINLYCNDVVFESIMEVSKYKSLVKDKKDSQSDTAYYINFFTDGTKVNAYWYSVSSIRNFGTIDYKYCPTTTAVDNGNYYKKVIMIPSNKAQRFALVNGRWNNVLDSKP